MSTDTTGNGSKTTNWGQVAVQYGFATAALSAVLYFVAYEMILPMQATHTKLVERVSEVNEKNAETNRRLVETQQRQTEILEEIRENSKP